MDFNQYVKDNVLSVEKSTINMSELVGFLKDNRNITKLSLFQCNIDNKDAKEFTGLTSISSLDLHTTEISIEAVKALAKLPNLAELKLSNAWQVNGIFIAPVIVILLLSIPLSIFFYMLCANATFDAALTPYLILICAAFVLAVPVLAAKITIYMIEVFNDRQSSKYVEALAHGNFVNLTSLDLGSNKISDKGIEALANGNLPNLTSLDLGWNKISDKGIEALVNGNLPNLTSLDLGWNKISDKGIEALANGNLPNLTSLDLGSNKISDKGIEALAKSHYLKSRARDRDCEYRGDKSYIHEFLIRLYSQNKSVGNFNPDSIKKAVFSTAQLDYQGEAIKYVLERSDKYPFLINSRDEQGHTLLHFYNHIPEVQQFLFEQGLIPEQERNQRRDDACIARDGQSVHASPIVKRTNFFTRKLVESMRASKKQLKQAEVSYVESIGLLKQYQNDPIRLRLLSFTDNEKGSVMKKTLRETDPIPGDEEFIKTVIDKAEQALKQQYLKKNFRGEYDQGYPTQELQYDYTRDDAKITIPESIGYIKLLIDNFSVPLKEKKELLVTLMEQNPDLVKNKLSKVKEKLGNSVILDKEQFNKAELHGLLNGIDDGKKVDELFKEISCLNIEEVWREQKEFVLLKQIYIAATTYGENSSACIQGTWSQIINSINEISSEVVAQYDRYIEEEQKLEAQKDVITKENIKPFMEGLANKLIRHVKLNPELKQALEDFVVGIVDIDKPGEITFEQQKILAEINKYFGENIRNVLQNYNRRNIPSRSEYGLVIEGLSEVEVMQKFVTDNSKVSSRQGINISASQKNDIQNNNIQPSPQNEKRSKLPIVAASVLAIAGVALGIAIAVHLEMLAVGVAVGACCLIAAAIIYYCTEPSKSLENSNVQGFSGNHEQLLCKIRKNH